MMSLCIFVTSVQVRNNGENNFSLCCMPHDAFREDGGKFQRCVQANNGILTYQRHYPVIRQV